MEKSFGLLFYLKKSKWDKVGDELNIYSRITVNGDSKEISSNRKFDPIKWNVIGVRVDNRTDNAKAINSYLDILQRSGLLILNSNSLDPLISKCPE